eukprot:TRINITY_DN17352_c0_g1_i1.p1 TRINITY_DN17352_c0_g1~~TRINITY_DN17352_c0_g1_i1.p1  ORF type:complete len:562 (-),score=88.74 TRINITY_DN17352_c0_g1_i1:115-1800(-)
MVVECLSTSEYIFAIWKLIIRPPRRRYTRLELSGPYPSRFRVGGVVSIRNDFIIHNSRGLSLSCTLFEPEQSSSEKACVVYCHGNASCRLDGFERIHALLPLNIALCCFDFAGSGMSEGDHVSLGYYERDDLSAVVDHLRERCGFSRVGLWGTSMGAVTTLLHAARDPTLAGVVADSPFSDLWGLIQEICSSKVRLPHMAWNPVLQGIRMMIQKEANFDICEVSPIAHVDSCFVPALFLHGAQDDFVLPHHSEDLKKAYQGEATYIVMPDTDHNSARREKFLARSALFFVRAFRWEQFVDPAAMTAIMDGLFPTMTNQQKCMQARVDCRLAALGHLPQTAVSSEICNMVLSADTSECHRGVLMAAAELSYAYRGSEILALEQNGNAAPRSKLPALFKGKLCFGSEDTELSFSWVAGKVPRSGEYCIFFVVISPRVLSLSRMLLKIKSSAKSYTTERGVELLSIEEVQLPLRKQLDFELRIPTASLVEVVVDGNFLGSGETSAKLEPQKLIEPFCWCWRAAGDSVLDARLSVDTTAPESPQCHNRNSGSSLKGATQQDCQER